MSGYAELMCRTNFSFLRGGSHPHELVERAAVLGHKAIGIADDSSLAGIVRAHEAAKEHGIKLLVGARLDPLDTCEVILYATDRKAYARLCRLLTLGRRRAPKGECHLLLDDIADYSEGLIALVIPEQDNEALAEYKTIFADRCYMAVTRHLGDDDRNNLERQFALAQRYDILPVATNDVHYHVHERQPLQDILTCIREGCTIHEAGHHLFANAERYLKEETRMRALFASYEHAVDRTLEITERCTFSLDELRYEYPHEVCPEGVTLPDHLRNLTYQGAEWRYPRGIPPKVREVVEKELELIGELHYEPYFLTVYDLVRFARSKEILCQGRGSAANSAVCFCLGITSVDPAHHDVLFERFLSRERAEPPDIDVDFEHERREEVMQYIYEKYGRERAGLTATVITYRRKSALREVGKAMGLSLDQVGALSKHVDSLNDPEVLKQRLLDAGLDGNDRTIRLVLRLTQELKGFPRHLSQHVGGFVMTRDRLDELVPIENAAMEDRTVIEWDKDDIDALGILKVDCLSLGMLTAIRKTFGLIENHQGNQYTLASVLGTDDRDPCEQSEPTGKAKGVYDMIQEADTIGVFQIESRAQMSMLPRLKPKCFYDLVIEVAIVRPGPIQGGMVHPYLRRRDGKEEIDYPHECTVPVLGKTLGIPLFQEQVMQLAVVAAGYTPGEADKLRKDMAAWRRTGNLERHKDRLFKGMTARGISQEFCERVFEQIKGFSSYGFPESHAASFALLAYVSCYLKRFYPAAFLAGLLNSQPLGFYSASTLVRDAWNHGVEILPADINHSQWDSTLEGVCDGIPEEDSTTWGHGGPKVRLGLRQIKGLRPDAVEVIEAQRSLGSFNSVENFCRRAKLDRSSLTKLAEADAFASIGVNRRDALWQVKAWEEMPPLLKLLPEEVSKASLPYMSVMEHITQDYKTVGLSLRPHPLSLIRDELTTLGISTSAEVRSASTGDVLDIAGIVLCRQRPGTAKGVIFLTIEDEAGTANIVVWRKVSERHRRIVRTARIVRIRGHVERDESGKVVHLIAEYLEELSLEPARHTTSRDFH